MFKNKSLIVILVIFVVFLLGFGSLAFIQNNNSGKSFSTDGYILIPEKSSLSGDANTQYYFAKGTKYEMKYPKKLTFRDTESNQVSIDSSVFVHYNDGGLSAFSKGVIVDLNDLDKTRIQYYGLSADTKIEKTGNNYILLNRNESMKLNDFIWKIDQNKYLITSDSIEVNYSKENIKTYSSYIELTYYDSGIVRIMTQEGTWQTIASDCQATLANGTTIQLAKKVVSSNGGVHFSLNEMVIDSDDNIEIISDTASNVVPTFDIVTIDGTDGEDGNNGETGESGSTGSSGTNGAHGATGANGNSGQTAQSGNAGDAGITGASGNNGTNGGNGASGISGNSGANGQDGDDNSTIHTSNPNSETKVVLPVFQVNRMDVKSHSVQAKINLLDEESRMDVTKQVFIALIDNGTGKEVYTTYEDASLTEYDVTCNTLTPNTEYTLQISASYIVNNVSYEKEFLSKTFNTDALGIAVKQVAATSSSFTFVVNKKDYSDVSIGDLQLLDADGNVVVTKSIAITEASSKEGDTVEFDGLHSNQTYILRLANLQLTSDSNLVVASEKVDDYKTLKETPIIGEPIYIVNQRDSSFQCALSSVNDKEKGIVSYSYELYTQVREENAKPVKTITTKNNETVSFMVDGTTIQRGIGYQFRVVVEFYDNKKTVKLSSGFSEGFSMEGSVFPTVSFQQETTYPDQVNGVVMIQTNGANLIINESKPLKLELTSSVGVSDTLKITDYNALTVENNLITIPYNLDQLKADTNYVLSVYGTIDLNDGLGEQYNLIGSTIAVSRETSTFQANIQDDSSDAANTSLNFKFQLRYEEDEAHQYDANIIRSVKVNLYNTNDVDNISSMTPIASTIVNASTSSGGDNNAFLDEIYNEDDSNFYEMNEKNFTGLDLGQITTDQYVVELEYAADGTEFPNKIMTNHNAAVLRKKKTVPSLDEINLTDGLTIKTIRNADYALYASYGAEYDSDLPDDAIIGYDLQAKYPNDDGLAEEFYYYAFRSTDYDHANQDFDALYNNQWVATQTKTVVGQIVPKAVFLFGKKEAKEMERGNKYYFTYRVKLNDSVGDNFYFPDHASEDGTKPIVRSILCEAPYVTPTVTMYQSSVTQLDGVYTLTWRYLCNEPDKKAITQCNDGAFQITGGSPTEETKFVQFDISSDLTLTNLHAEDKIAVNLAYNLYDTNIYNDANSTVICGKQYVQEIKKLDRNASDNLGEEKLRLTYTIEPQDDSNRLKVMVNVPKENVSQIKRTVGLRLRAVADGVSEKTIDIPIDQITGSEQNGYVAVGYLRYTDLGQTFVGKEIKLDTSIVYATGTSGFGSVSDGSLMAIQKIGYESLGNYIGSNVAKTDVEEKSNCYATDSFYKVTVSSLDLSSSSEFNMTIVDQLDQTFTKSLSLSCGSSGAKLTLGSKEELVTLVKLDEAVMNYGDSNSEYVTFMFNSLLPTVSFYKGDFLDTVTTVSYATSTFTIAGLDSFMPQDGSDLTLYFELTQLNSNKQELTDTKEVSELKVSGNGQYSITFSELLPETYYTFNVYFMSDGEKKYPLEVKYPSVSGVDTKYTFTTVSKVNVTYDDSKNKVTYVANSYLDKYIYFTYTLDQTLGFSLKYTLYQKNAAGVYNEYLSNEEMKNAGILNVPNQYQLDMGTRLYFSPGQISKQSAEGVKSDYFKFGEENQYAVGVQAVSSTDMTSELGDETRIDFQIDSLIEPYYNVQVVPGVNDISYKIAINDVYKVMVNGNYKVKIVSEDGEDVTPSEYVNKTFNMNAQVMVTIDHCDQNKKYYLQIFTNYDLNNSGVDSSNQALRDMAQFTLDEYTALNESSKYYKKTFTGTVLDAKGYNLGTTQVSTTNSSIKIYFLGQVNLDTYVTKLQYTILKDDSVTVAASSAFRLNTDSNGDSFIELPYNFGSQASGKYILQLRLYNNNTALEDLVLTYIKE